MIGTVTFLAATTLLHPDASITWDGSWKEDRIQKKIKRGNMKILTEIEKYVNAFPLGIDPCGMCENKDKIKGHSYDVCRSCCYYYASNFKIKGNKK